jgi:transposase
MAIRIEPYIAAQIITDWQHAPRNHKGATVAKWAAMIGVSEHTIYRVLPSNRQRKKGERKRLDIESVARTIAVLKNSPPDHRGVISTEDAIKIALINNKIPAGYADVHHSSIDRVIRDLGLNAKRRRVERFQAEYPNEMHHVDASSSNCFYIYKALPDGDFLLRLHRGNKDYKNKPIPVDGLRPWIYGMTDDHSGCHCCRYVAARGEQATHNMEFLAWAWWQQPDKCFWGVPSHPLADKRGLIKGDHGPMMESPIAKDFFERCIVDIDPSAVLNKETHGKIERPWRTLWQKFELPFFAMSDWKKFEITMSELNSQLINYSIDYNEMPHRYERKLSRRQAWERISRHGGVVILPDDALETIAKSNVERTVNQEGVFWLDNIPYEVKGLHDAKVKVIIGVYDKKMVVEDLKDGRKYEVEAFAPNKLGEYTANPETGQQQMRKEAEKSEGITIPLYSAEGRAALAAPSPVETRKVLKMPTRVKETLQLVNPLNLDSYHTIDQALQEFQTLCGFFLGRDMRAEVAELIVENGMSKRFVAELAGEIQAEQMQQTG